jgi:hypothetical protein
MRALQYLSFTDQQTLQIFAKIKKHVRYGTTFNMPHAGTNTDTMDICTVPVLFYHFHYGDINVGSFQHESTSSRYRTVGTCDLLVCESTKGYPVHRTVLRLLQL